MRRLVSLALVILGGAEALATTGEGTAARPLSQEALSQEAVDDAQLAAWVAQLADPRRARRLEARARLMSQGLAARERIAAIAPPEGEEARRALAYILEHLPRLPRPCAVPAGRYELGSNSLVDQNPRRSLQLAAYTLDECEVTNFEYRRFVQATGAPAPEGWEQGEYPYGQDRFPVRGVSFTEAQAFARWVGGRLPRAEEWEVAAHGGKTPTAFPWGDQPPSRLSNAGGRLVAVGSEDKDRSPVGCLDMAASVSEWVVGPEGPACCGGSYLSRVGFLRVTRGPVSLSPQQRRAAIGFRVADRR